LLFRSNVPRLTISIEIVGELAGRCASSWRRIAFSPPVISVLPPMTMPPGMITIEAGSSLRTFGAWVDMSP
jgi:hypothetical protein